MTPTGLGWFAWMVTDPEMTLSRLRQSGASWVAVKGGDGTALMRQNVLSLLPGARKEGIAVYAWAVAYLKDPAGEAQVMAALSHLGVDGVIADCEDWANGRESAAALYTRLVRAKVSIPFGHTGMSSPSLFPAFPWRPFAETVDFFMPQWYAPAYPPSPPMEDEFATSLPPYLGLGKPVVPLGPTFGHATPKTVDDLVSLTQAHSLPAWGFYRIETASDAEVAAAARHVPSAVAARRLIERSITSLHEAAALLDQAARLL